MTALTANPDNYKDISIELFLGGYNEPQVETAIPADSVDTSNPDYIPINKEFYYSYVQMKQSISFSTMEPVIGGTFYLESYMKESLGADEDFYEVKIYHDDELFDVKIISAKGGSSYTGEVLYLLEPNVL